LDLKTYLEARKFLVECGYNNEDNDDVMDAFVEVSADEFHLTDEDLYSALAQYRQFEVDNPEYVQRGDALVAE
jgi:hypothetical protein